MFYRKKILLLSVSVIVFSLCVIPIQTTFAASRIIPVGADETISVTYRDITNLDPTPEPLIYLDKASYFIGETVILTIEDFNANLDVNSEDEISALVNSQSIPLLETEVNSHIFVGEFPFQVRNFIEYSPDPLESVRAEVTLGVTDPGNVIISDYIIDENELANLSFTPVIHGVDVQIANGATLDGTNAVVTLSYANGSFFEGDDKSLLQMYYRPGPDFGWSVITLFSDPDSNNQDAQTITSDPETAFIEFPVTTGQYVLGFETGSSGGGGGGLIRPGLVLNLLAGITAGSGIDRSPPSLNFAKPPESQDGFGGILVTEDNTNSFPLVINGNGYYLPAFSTTIEPVELTTGQDVDLTLTFLESTGVEHVALHIVDESSDELSDSDAIITFDKGTVTKSDSNGILADDITFSQSKEGNKYSFNFGFSFDQPGNRHLMIKAWDSNKNSGNTKVFDAFAVSGEPIPDDGIGHMIYLDLGAFFITPNGIWIAGEKVTTAQPVIEYQYPDSVGRMERHDSIIYDQINNEKTRANQVISEKYNLETETFVANDTLKPFDTRRAPELSLTTVGHKIRDFTLSPEENKLLIKELAWQEYLKAQKILDLMYPNLRN
jgi:hypothetical protein